MPIGRYFSGRDLLHGGIDGVVEGDGFVRGGHFLRGYRDRCSFGYTWVGVGSLSQLGLEDVDEGSGCGKAMKYQGHSSLTSFYCCDAPRD